MFSLHGCVGEVSRRSLQAALCASERRRRSLVDSVLTSFTDISAVKQAQQALRDSEKKFRTLFEAMDQGYCIIEVLYDEAGEACDCRFLDVNAAFQKHSGLPHPAGKRILELVPDAEPKWFGIFGGVARTGESVRLVDYSTALGRWFDLYAYRIEAGGNPKVAIHFNDITARKRSENALRESDERVRLATEATGVGIWEWNVSTTDIRWDAEMFRIFGVTPTPDGTVPYSAWRDAVLPAELARQEEVLRETVSHRGQSIREFHILRANDGECRLIQGVETVRTNASGEVEWVVGTNLDVTEQKQREEAIRSLNQELESRVVARTAQLRAAVAKVETEIEKRRRLEREILEIAEREQSRLGQDLHDGLGQELAGISLLSNALANDLQAASHPSAKAAASIAKYTNSTIESARMLARGLYPIELSRRGLLFALEDLADLTNLRTSVSCELHSEGPAAVLEPSTEIHIYRIVQECIGNAIKHGKANRITIEFLTGENFHVIAVTDNGVGFTENPDSDGMGLHLMEYRARLIGARIKISSPATGGCRVECRLPA